MQNAQEWYRHYRSIMELAVPLMLGHILSTSIWAVDTVMMGWINSDALAAGAQATRLLGPFLFITIGLLTAISPLTAQALGAGSKWAARRVIRQGILLAIFCAIISMPPIWYGDKILIMLGQDVALAQNAAPFLKMMTIGIIPIFLHIALRNYIVACKKTIVVAVISIFGFVLNCALNLVLSKGLFGMPAMGIAGIGLATTLSFCMITATLMIYINYYSNFQFIMRPDGRIAQFYKIDLNIIKRLLKIGVPVAFTVTAETGLFIFSGFYMGLFGTNAVAAAAIVIQIAAVAFMIPLALAHAATVSIGHEAGAGNAADTIRAGVVSLLLTVVFCLLITIVLLIFGEAIIRVFLNPDDINFATVLELTLPMLTIVAVFQIFDGLQGVFAGVLRGMNDTRIPAVLSLIGFWGIGVSMAILLSTYFGIGPNGVWLGILLGLASASVFLGLRCFSAYKRVATGGRIIVL